MGQGVCSFALPQQRHEHLLRRAGFEQALRRPAQQACARQGTGDPILRPRAYQQLQEHFQRAREELRQVHELLRENQKSYRLLRLI